MYLVDRMSVISDNWTENERKNIIYVFIYYMIEIIATLQAYSSIH